MQSLLSVHTSYNEAAQTINELKDAGYADDQLSLLNRNEIINNHIYLRHNDHIESLEIILCVVLGLTFGLLLGTGVIDLPMEHFTRATGLLVGVAIGVATGFLSGIILAALTYVVVERVNAIRYQHLLNDGQYLVFVNGDQNEINYASKIAHTEGLQWELA